MRTAIAAAVSCLVLLGATATAQVHASMKMHTDIPEQSLGDALRALATSRGVQLIYLSDDIENRHTPGAVGELTVDQALKKLLSGSGLEYRYVDENTISIYPHGTAPASSQQLQDNGADPAPQLASSSIWGRLRLAQLGAAESTVPDTTAGYSAGNSDGTTERTSLEEVVVTAQKRSERLIDVPMSIVAVSGQELRDRQIVSVDDLPTVVPGFSITKGGNYILYEIRGVSNVYGNGPLIGMYFDDTPVTLPGAFQLNPLTYDLERVEVLRGPQGTLYGAGSAGGTVRLISRQPDLTQWDLESQVTAMFTQEGDPSQRLNFAASVPLIDHELGIRVSGTFEHDGGWIDQLSTAGPAGNGQNNINPRDIASVRIKGLWQPFSELTVSGTVMINRDRHGFDFSDHYGLNPKTGNAPYSFTPTFIGLSPGWARTDYNLYSLTVAYNLSPTAKVSNTVSYTTVNEPQLNMTQDFPADAPNTVYRNAGSELSHNRDWTDELRFTSTGSGPWQWTAGGYFARAKEEDYAYNFYLVTADRKDPPGPLPEPFPGSPNGFTYKSYSVFTDTNYRLWDRLTLGAGVRYFREDQFYPYDSEQTARFHSVDPRAYAQFKLTPNLNVYASAAKGFRSGGINGGSKPPYAPESVWTYETGTKMALLQGRVQVDTAVFVSNYTNYVIFGQIPTSGNPMSFYSNAGYARIKGIDSSIAWQLSPAWRVEAKGEYLNGRFTNVNVLNPSYDVGEPLDLVPRYQVTLSDEHDFVLSGKRGSVRLDYSQKAQMSFRNHYLNGPDQPATPWDYATSGVIRLLSLHASLQLSDDLRLGVFGQNLINDQRLIIPFWFQNQGIRSRPRTFGIELSWAAR